MGLFVENWEKGRWGEEVDGKKGDGVRKWML